MQLKKVEKYMLHQKSHSILAISEHCESYVSLLQTFSRCEVFNPSDDLRVNFDDSLPVIALGMEKQNRT